MIRLCMSGTEFCSGCNPCEQCHIAIMSRVMPKAMIAGGFNDDPEQAKAFLQAYMAAFRVLQGDIIKAMQELATKQAAEANQASPAATALTGDIIKAMQEDRGANTLCTAVDSNGVRCEKPANHPPPCDAPEALARFRAKQAPKEETKPEIPSEAVTATELPESPAETTEVPLSSGEPEPAAPTLDIPSPQVEGLTGLDAVPDAPTSDTVPKKHRKTRGLPRSLRRRSS